MHTTSLPKLCAVIQVTSVAAAIGQLAVAQPLADWIELRVDYLPNPRAADLSALRPFLQRPTIVCCRHTDDGGQFSGNRQAQYALLKAALALGYDTVDIDWLALDVGIADLDLARCILSYHHFTLTPPLATLRRFVMAMRTQRPYAVKIATYVTQPAAARELLFLAQEQAAHARLIIVGMGEKGQTVRLLAPLLGGYLTYAMLPGFGTAPGQLTLTTMQQTYQRLLTSGKIIVQD